MIENFFVWRCWKKLGFCRCYCAPLLNPIYSVKKKNPFVPWVSFFLLVVFAKDTWGGVVALEESFLIHKCLSAQQEKPCVSNTLLPKSCSESATKQGQTLQIKEASIQTHTHRQHHRIARAIVPAPQKFKSTCCYSIWFFSLFFFDGERGAEDEKHI